MTKVIINIIVIVGFSLGINVSCLGQVIFDEEKLIYENPKMTWNILDFQIGDIDGDGYEDIVVNTNDKRMLLWYKNDGTGLFGKRNIIDLSYTLSIFLTDIDNDGDIDVFAAQHSRFYWYKNQGNGEFEEQPFLTNNYAASGFHTIDLNNDGWKDIVTTIVSNEGKLVWFKNYEQGNFGPPQTIAGQMNSLTYINVSDIDNDGDKDIIAVFKNKNIVKYKNFGNENFGQQELILNNNKPIYYVKTTDFDEDKFMDIVYVELSGEIFRLKNDGNGKLGAAQAISDVENVRHFEIEDINQDGYKDILVSNLTGLFVYTNDGMENFEGYKIDSQYPFKIKVCDLNNDGFKDLVCGDDNSIHGYLNKGDGKFGDRQTVVQRHGINHIQCMDIDNDGYLDILYAGQKSAQIIIQKNDGNKNFGKAEVLHTDSKNIEDFIVADVDGDNDNDLLFSSFSPYKIAWFPNEANGNFAPQKNISTTIDWPHKLFVTDINNDGDEDVLIGTYINPIWIENSGNGNFGLIHYIDSTAFEQKIDIVDMDDDGDVDIIMNFGYSIVLQKNKGFGVFEKKSLLKMDLECLSYRIFILVI